MLDSFVYVNHQNKRFEGLKNRVFLNYNSLRDYSWSYDTINNRISRFYKKVTTRSVPLVVCCETEEEAKEIMNSLHQIVEADIQAMSPGKIYIGEYYTTGYITVSKKTKYLISGRFCKIDLTLLSDNPAWYRETTHSFTAGEAQSSVTTGTDYPYDYTYDYSASLKSRNILCDSIGDNAFRLLIYGEATNPIVTIGDHQYTVNGTIAAGETLLIDSVAKTIVMTTAAGKQTNWFDKRGRESYIFEPISAGSNSVVWNETFGFDLTIVEERSEPKWT